MLACVVRSGMGRVTLRPEQHPLESATLGRSLPGPGRVLIRVPLVGALLQATARLSHIERGTEYHLVLDTFANVRCEERRTAARLDQPVPVRVQFGAGDRPCGEDTQPVLTATNLSSRGLLLAWLNQPDLALGERAWLTIILDTGEITVEGEVIRVDPRHTAIRFVHIVPKDQRRIEGFVFRYSRFGTGYAGEKDG